MLTFAVVPATGSDDGRDDTNVILSDDDGENTEHIKEMCCNTEVKRSSGDLPRYREKG